MLDYTNKQILGPLVLRLGLATVFVFHGLEKVNAETEWGAAWTEGFLAIEQMLVAYGSLLCGVALLFGFLTRFAALGASVVVGWEIHNLHGQNGFSVITEEAGQIGFEYHFVLAALCLALLIMGGGVVSLDKLLFSKSRPRRDHQPNPFENNVSTPSPVASTAQGTSPRPGRPVKSQPSKRR